MILFQNDKNSPLVIIITFFGMLVRYVFINLIRLASGRKPKQFYDFANGFRQILYNILILFLIFFLMLIYMLYEVTEGFQ
jgi:hypothetical protein